MSDRRSFVFLVAIVALIVVAVALAIGWRLIRGDDTLIRSAAMSTAEISPNADGDNDIALFSYELARNADVSIYFEDQDGQRYHFRDERPRGKGRYEVYFSGVVEGYGLPGEVIQGEIVSRLLQDGVYNWTLEATDESGNVEQAQGSLTISNADNALPEMRNFTLDRDTFSPNRDGIDDRVEAQFWLEKPASVRVFLLTPEGVELPIAEKDRGVPAGEVGRHYFDYEGGVDFGATPPPDGEYTIVALAEDPEGQTMRVENRLTIELGGVPRAEIVSPPVGDTLEFNTTSVVVCGTLYFTLTVENYGETPIRTTGPLPGTVYDSDWNANTLGWPTESGAWRVGIGFENSLSDYPFRWALGQPEELTEIDGHYYLMPGQRAVITGGIRLVDELGVRNPQPVWAGLIHEDVEISQFNNRVDPHDILIEFPDPDSEPECEPRQAEAVGP
jgi:hypothetical protein